MTTARTTTGALFCGHCSADVATGRAHTHCPEERCACAAAGHRPKLELARRMLTSQAPDLAREIARGDYDARLFFPV